MTSRFIDTIRAHCLPLDPQPTGVQPVLAELHDIRAVLFDIYGTLLISASGDIGLDSGDHKSRAMRDVIKLFDLRLNRDADDASRVFEERIRAEHVAARKSGIPHPEVNIVEVWRNVLGIIVDEPTEHLDFEAFSVEFEVRVNPTWPMPDLEATLSKLHQTGLVLGIVSNAQFFTPLLFPALLDRTLDEMGFIGNLSYFSYAHRQAKPSQHLYELARKQLVERGMSPQEVLYVGNDMLNDVTPAGLVGFRTALFAGDERSLRWRRDDERVRGVEADIVLTELPQLIECLPNNLKEQAE